MVCILSSTYSQPLHEIRFYTRAKQIPLRQHCINCIGLILHRTVTIVSNLNGKTGREQKIFPHNLFSLWFCRRSYVSHQHRNAPKIFHCFEMEFLADPHPIHDRPNDSIPMTDVMWVLMTESISYPMTDLQCFFVENFSNLSNGW